MIQQIYTIARNTFLESIRQPVFVVLILIAIGGLMINIALAAYTLKDDNKLLLDMGLSTIFITGLLLAAFTATGVLSREVENKTVLTVISKPVSRSLFVLGKFVGVSGAIAMAYWVLSLVFLLTVRHKVMQTASDHLDKPVVIFGAGAIVAALLFAAFMNYFYRWIFPSTFAASVAVLLTFGWIIVLFVSKEWTFQSPMADINPQLLLGLILEFLGLLILVAVAIAASTRLGQVMTLAICGGVFLLGLINDGTFGKWQESHLWAKVAHNVSPNLQLLWPADALTQGHAFTPSYIGLAVAYSLLYVGAVLGVAVALFQTREVG